MTVGFPDWSRTVNQGGQQLGGFFGQKGTDPTTGVMDCLGFAYLTVQVGDAGNVHNFSVVVTWYSDKNGTNIVNTSTIVPVPGSNLSYQIDLVSRYARVTASHQVFGDTENIGAIVFGSNVQVYGAIVGPQAFPFMMFDGTIGAGASTTVSALYTYWGRATVSVSDELDSLWNTEIQYYDIGSATFRRLLFLDGSQYSAGAIVPFSLPPCPVRMKINNNSTASGTLHANVSLG